MYWLVRNYRGDAIYCMKEQLPWNSYHNTKRNYKLQIFAKMKPFVGYELYVLDFSNTNQYLVKWTLIYTIIKIPLAEYETYLEMKVLEEIPYTILMESMESIIKNDTVLSYTMQINKFPPIQ